MNIIEKRIVEKVAAVNVDVVPEITSTEYQERLNALRQLMREKGLTHTVIYADREHFSNMEYLTGYDPRFEEAVLIVSQDERPVLVVGNEGFDYSDIVPYDLVRALYSPFSLPGQPIHGSDSLSQIFTRSGITDKAAVGVIGWKLFSQDAHMHVNATDLPLFIHQSLLGIVKAEQSIVNATDIMISNDYGLRHHLDAKELVLAEIAGTKASRKVSRVIASLKEDVSELETSGYFGLDAEPLAVHPIVSFGLRNISLGLASPTPRVLTAGDWVCVGLSYRRANNHRTGLYARQTDQLSSNIISRYDGFFKPYFAALATWYETMRIGITGSEMVEALENLPNGLNQLGIKLNPGHQIHTEEWTNSLFYKGSKSAVRSGMAIQCDIIAGTDGVFAHAEDGILIADEKMREEIKRISPDCWQRIALRRAFMKRELGIHLNDEVLPTSDIQGVYHPCLCGTSVFAKE